jgi:hypothetical protein
VSRFDAAGWRVLDFTSLAAEALYVSWLQHQPMLRDVLVTVHGDYVNHLLRDQFREQFRLDCILFHPDERDSAGLYTPGGDVWMAVGDFDAAGRLKTGASAHFHDVRLVVVLEEEFEVDTPAITRSAILALSNARQTNAVLSADIAAKYSAAAGWTRVSS